LPDLLSSSLLFVTVCDDEVRVGVTVRAAVVVACGVVVVWVVVVRAGVVVGVVDVVVVALCLVLSRPTGSLWSVA
jgi:hypothetical protein